MNMRDYCSELDGPLPTADEELRARGLRSLIGIVCAPLVVAGILWALAAVLP